MELLILYILTTLMVLGIVNTWLYSTIKVHLVGLFIKDPDYKEIITLDDWENYMICNQGKLGELLTCKICLSHWVSLVVSILALAFYGTFAVWFPVFCFFSIPFFVSKLL